MLTQPERESRGTNNTGDIGTRTAGRKAKALPSHRASRAELEVVNLQPQTSTITCGAPRGRQSRQRQRAERALPTPRSRSHSDVRVRVTVISDQSVSAIGFWPQRTGPVADAWTAGRPRGRAVVTRMRPCHTTTAAPHALAPTACAIALLLFVCMPCLPVWSQSLLCFSSPSVTLSLTLSLTLSHRQFRGVSCRPSPATPSPATPRLPRLTGLLLLAGSRLLRAGRPP